MTENQGFHDLSDADLMAGLQDAREEPENSSSDEDVDGTALEDPYSLACADSVAEA